MMDIFEGYIPFNFEEGVPYVSVTKNGVTFNKSVIMKMGYPRKVVLLINPDERKIAIQACCSNTPRCVDFYKENEKGILSVRWNARDLLNTLQDIMGWDLSMESYRIEGDLLKFDNAMLFDLTTAKRLQ